MFAIVDFPLQLTQYKTNHPIPLTLQKKTHEHLNNTSWDEDQNKTFSAM